MAEVSTRPVVKRGQNMGPEVLHRSYIMEHGPDHLRALLPFLGKLPRWRIRKSRDWIHTRFPRLNRRSPDFKREFRAELLDQARRNRNQEIFLDWNRTENKAASISLSAERFDLTRQTIYNILKRCATTPNALPVGTIEVSEAWRLFKARRVFEDGESQRQHLADQREKIEESKQDWVDIEQTEDGRGTSTKSIPKGKAIGLLHKETQESHKTEAGTLSHLIEAPVQRVDSTQRRQIEIVANKQTQDFLSRLAGWDKREEIPVDAEVVE